jgi:hypothetical protein
VPWSEAINFEGEGRRDADFMLLSLPMSDYFLTATEATKTLPRFLSHMTRSNARGTGMEAGRAVLGMLGHLALKVSQKYDFFGCCARPHGVWHI